jgi:hypothetical protein
MALKIFGRKMLRLGVETILTLASTLARLFSRHSSLQLIFVLQKKNIGTRSLMILLGTFSFHA